MPFAYPIPRNPEGSTRSSGSALRSRPLLAFMLVVALMMHSSVRAQERSPDRPVPQTSNPSSPATDSLRAAPGDSLEHFYVPPGTGKLLDTTASLCPITRHNIQWNDYKYVGDLFEHVPGTFTRTQSGFGQYDALWIRGTDWRGVAVLANGRPLNDPLSGIYNLHYYSVEEANEVEIVTGPSAFMYGLNATGGTINLVQKTFHSPIPYSRLRYAENGYNYQFTDGVISQNLSRRANIALGFQRTSTDGRFDNSNHASWIIRAQARYNFTPTSLLLLSERYLTSETGLNGGIDTAQTGSALAFVPQQAIVVNQDSYEKITRHDIDLSFVAQPFADSTDLSQVTIYYSTSLREYRDEENRQTPNGITVQSDHRTSWMGTRAQQHLTIGKQTLTVGGSLELRRIDSSPAVEQRDDVLTALWARAGTRILTPVMLSLFARYDNYLGHSYTGAGVELQYLMTSSLTLFAGGSVSYRMPSYMELFWNDSTVQRSAEPSAELHRYAELGVAFNAGKTIGVRLAAFQRNVEHPIIFSPSATMHFFPGINIRQEEERTSRGLDVSAKLHISFLYLEGTALYLLQEDAGGSQMSEQPKLTAQGGLFFWDSLLEDKLELKAGFTGRYASRSTGPRFNPEVLAYVDLPSSTGAWARVDFVAQARIGSAYVHFSWENLTNINYYGTPYYPGLDRSIRFGISWEFLN